MHQKLIDICDIQYGYPFDAKQFCSSDGIPLVRIRDIARGYSETYTKEPFPDSYIVNNDDILIGMDGEFNIARWKGGVAALNQRVCRLMPHKGIDDRYLFYIMPKFLKRIEESTPFVTVKHLSAAKLNEIELNIPPIEQQTHVADILDSVNRSTEFAKEQLKLFDNLVESRFIEMFGDPVTNPMGWETARLAELGELNRGVSKHRPRNAPELLNGPYPLVQTGDVANADTYIKEYSSTYSEVGLKQSRMWSKGTLCITIAANIAKTGILTFDACFPDSVVGFIAGERTNQLYIHRWFSFFQKILEEQAPQSAQKNINLQILSNLSVMIPPIDIQNQFAELVELADKSKLTIQKSLENLTELRDSLMQDYFG